MGYTMEGKKVVIWFTKRSENDPWPSDEVTRYWDLYENLRGCKAFMSCLAGLPETDKIKLVAEKIGVDENKIVFRSKGSHYKAHPRKKNV
jgi:hypothetical protein